MYLCCLQMILDRAGRNMDLSELKKALKDLGWQEQMNFEIGERYPQESEAMEKRTNLAIQELAKKITPELLNALEEDNSYLVWVLRLSPFVPGDLPAVRAQRYLNHPKYEVSAWAESILELLDRK
jgi:hypothetical protein